MHLKERMAIVEDTFTINIQDRGLIQYPNSVSPIVTNSKLVRVANLQSATLIGELSKRQRIIALNRSLTNQSIYISTCPLTNFQLVID